jgi:3-oxoacyl-[acyl-carrier-protein] synthase I
MEIKMAIEINNETKNAYVAGTNLISPLGFGTNENFTNITAQKSGLKIVQKLKLKGEFCISEIDENWLNELFFTYGNNSSYSKLEKMSILSIANAASETNIDLKAKDTLLIYCTTKGNINLLPNYQNNDSLLSDLVQKVADYFGFANTPMIVSNACISGTQGIVIGQRLIKSGAYKNVVVVGGEIVSDFTLSGFKAVNAISNEPCKPFDEDRIGVNLGEAIATIILNSEPTQNQLIKVVDGHITNDANHISSPSRTGEGLYKAIAKLSRNFTEKIDFISAHGTATRYNDEMESQAFFRANLTSIPTQSLKGNFGHTLGAAGVLEAVMGVESLKQNITIASKGYQKIGTTYTLNIIEKSESKPLKNFIKTASGFGGCNAALLFSKIQYS